MRPRWPAGSARGLSPPPGPGRRGPASSPGRRGPARPRVSVLRPRGTSRSTPARSARGCRVGRGRFARSEEHTSELQSRQYLVCRLLLEKKLILTNSQTHHLPAECTHINPLSNSATTAPALMLHQLSLISWTVSPTPCSTQRTARSCHHA